MVTAQEHVNRDRDNEAGRNPFRRSPQPEASREERLLKCWLCFLKKPREHPLKALKESQRTTPKKRTSPPPSFQTKSLEVAASADRRRRAVLGAEAGEAAEKG